MVTCSIPFSTGTKLGISLNGQTNKCELEILKEQIPSERMSGN